MNSFYFSFSTVELFYRKKVSYRKILGYRFETGDNFLNKIGSKYSTKCFCTTTLDKIPRYDDGCLYKGVMDLSLCHGKCFILSINYKLSRDKFQPYLHGAKRSETQIYIHLYSHCCCKYSSFIRYSFYVERMLLINSTKVKDNFILPTTNIFMLYEAKT